ncbi:hypothetical protein BD779DRAFT_1491482 [Infundibulicybe gibba]|nr:hypothetical protein BD779DRAFT_1491482 [Infundibulicybe gibba]
MFHLLIPAVRHPAHPPADWIGAPLRFNVEHKPLRVPGYQLYAVEKWCVERTRAVLVLVVHTGDPTHLITVTTLTTHTENDWNSALRLLARDGARPQHIAQGTLLVTSLAHFRSDYTIVHIPDGDYLAVRDRLYTNINLLRTGSSGRSALTLDVPSDSTLDRFLATYHLPRPHPQSTVLELVRIVQAALLIFGLYAGPVDGLLCDATVDAINRSSVDVPHLEPMDRILDPVSVATLLSLVLATRNKLASLGYAHIVPKDPFLQPHDFILALAVTHGNSSSPVPLTRKLLATIDTAHDNRSRPDIVRRVRRDLASDGESESPASPASGIGASGGQLLSGIGTLARTGIGFAGTPLGASSVLEPFTDLAAFVRVITRDEGKRHKGIGRERRGSVDAGSGIGHNPSDLLTGVAGSLKALWSGHVAVLVKIRESGRDYKRGRTGERWTLSDGDAEEPGGRSTEEDADLPHSAAGAWGLSERVQKKLGSWAGHRLHKKKGHTGSLDISSRSSLALNRSPLKAPYVPTLATRSPTPEDHDEEPLSSGQTSPITAPSFAMGPNLSRNQSTDSRIALGPRKPTTGRASRSQSQSRISTWADPLSAREEATDIHDEPPPPHPHLLQRRRSFHDLASWHTMLPVLTPERMRIDVELCGQVLIASRRAQHLRNVLACVHVLTASLARTSSLLGEDYQTHLAPLSTLPTLTPTLAHTGAALVDAERIAQATHTLRYEAEQFHVGELWGAAEPPRRKVLLLRDKVFGTGGRRLPPGIHGAHGPFNKLQWTIDGQERLVDGLGRTESEAEEEEGVERALGTLDVPGDAEEERKEDQVGVVEHPGIKPMWLLRMFTSWGARWGAASPAAAGTPKDDVKSQEDPVQS